ncbi:MAG: nitronate monooxygenase, partial [Alphaproteobacteria bacterium]
LENELVRRWRGREGEMRRAQEVEAAHYEQAAAAGDVQNYGVIVGEAVGLVKAIEPAAAILERMVAQAEAQLGKAPQFLH